VILSGSQEILRYEPFAMAFSLRGTYLMWASLILILAASLVIDRFWCRYFCVVGMALSLLGKLGLRRTRGALSESAEMVGDF
jgi:polyferredoxin